MFTRSYLWLINKHSHVHLLLHVFSLLINILYIIAVGLLGAWFWANIQPQSQSVFSWNLPKNCLKNFPIQNFEKNCMIIKLKYFLCNDFVYFISPIDRNGIYLLWYIIIPPANEVAGVYSDPYVRPFVRSFVRSFVRPSVRPSLSISNPLLL